MFRQWTITVFVLFCVSGHAQECSDILKYGVFDQAVLKSDHSMVRDIRKIICKQEIGSASSAQSASAHVGIDISALLDVPLPVPIEAGGNTASSNWSQWKNTFCSDSEDFQANDDHLFVAFKTANPTIIAAWQNCTTKGLRCYVDDVSASGDRFVFRAVFLPQAVGVDRATVASFNPDNAQCSIANGKMITSDGVSVLCKRPSLHDTVVVLNTNRGTCNKKIDAVLPQPPVTPVAVTLDVRSVTASASSGGGPGNYPSAKAFVPDNLFSDGYTVLGGGCTVSYHGAGSEHAEVMVASRPIEKGWECKGADPANVGNAATSNATVIFGKALSSRSSVIVACKVRQASSGITSYPSVDAVLDQDLVSSGYVLTGGGCFSTHYGNGSAHSEPIVESAPSGNMQGWHCKGADPANVPNPAGVTAYAVGCRIEDLQPSKAFLLPRLQSDEWISDVVRPTGYPTAVKAVPDNRILTGGGCKVSYHDNGSQHSEHVVINSTVGSGQWTCRGADPPSIPNPATAQAIAVGTWIP